MQDINKLITDNFNDNIKYFEKNHPQVFDKLSSLDTAIANGHYKDKYELVYENDGFDVLEISTAKYLYNKESFGHSLASEHTVNYETSNYMYEGFVRHSYSEDEIQRIREAKEIMEYRQYTLDITQYTKRDYNQEKTLLTLDKFIFFGVGLGMHIEKIHQKIHSEVYLIVEDDLELFRLSLFTCNYKKLSGDATLIFSVFEDKEEFMYTSSVFLDTKNYLNQYIKFFYLLSHKEDKLEDFQLAITSQPHIRFLFNNLMLQYTQPLPYILEEFQVLNKSIQFNSKLSKLPFLVLASGPSLQNEIEWLKKNHQSFITIAVSSSLSFLEKVGIKPNIILHIDPFEWGVHSFNTLKSLDFIKDSIALFGTSTPSNIVSLIKKEKLFFFETGTNYKTDSLKLSSPCVGSMALQLLLILRAKNIYLLGLDLAIDSSTGKTHAGEHQSQKVLEKSDTSDEILSYKDSLFEIAGNFGTTVETTPGFYSSIYTIEHFTTKIANQEQTIYNLSNGAKFSNTTACKTKTISLAPLAENSQEEFRELLNSFASSTLEENDKKLLSLKLSHAQTLLKTLEHIHKLKVKDIATFIEDITNSVASQQDIGTYELSRVLNDYLHYIGSYIYDYFNTTTPIDTQKSLQELKFILIEQLKKLINYYINHMERT